MDEQAPAARDAQPPADFTPREWEMIAEGHADADAGRVIPWGEVRDWIDTWLGNAPSVTRPKR